MSEVNVTMPTDTNTSGTPTVSNEINPVQCAAILQLKQSIYDYINSKFDEFDIVDGNKTIQKRVILSNSSWTTTSPYIYTIKDTDIKANSIVNVSMYFNPTLEEIKAFSDAIMVSYEQVDGEYKLKAYGEKPIIDLPIMLTIGG